MKTLPLQDNRVAIIDDEDYERLSKYSWRVNNKGYVYRTEHSVAGKTKIKCLHHEILPKIDRRHVDHRLGNKLDNRRSELRYATPLQNAHNRGADKGKKYKGVSASKLHNGFIASINRDGKTIRLGIFNTAAEAAAVYNEAALIVQGKFARLNADVAKEITPKRWKFYKNKISPEDILPEGVYRMERRQWEAIIMKEGLFFHLGVFDSPAAASAAYQAAKSIPVDFIPLKQWLRQKKDKPK